MTSQFYIFSHSPEQTEQIAACLAKHLQAPVKIALEGDLGAGKTCFVRGLAHYFDPEAPVSSPTYALAQTYQTSPAIHHIDLYRAQKQNLEDLGILYLMEDPEAIVCVEWPAGAHDADIRLVFEHAEGETRRFKFYFSDRFSEEWVLTVQRDLLSLYSGNAG